MIFVTFLLILSSINAQELSNRRSNYDGYGNRLSSNNDIVLLASNDFQRLDFHFFPFGTNRFCFYRYPSSRMFMINVALIQNQTSNQISFVYLLTTDNEPTRLTLGRAAVSRTQCLSNSSVFTINQRETVNFQVSNIETSQLIVDFPGRYAYGFLSDFAYIYNISQNNVTFFQWRTLIPSTQNFYPRDAAYSITAEGHQVALVVGYFLLNSDKSLPGVYLFRLEPPWNMTLIDNLTLSQDEAISGTFVFSYSFDYALSISVEQQNQVAFITLPHYEESLLVGFNSTNLYLMKSYRKPARSSAWLDDGIQVLTVLSGVETLPWAQSQVQILNTSIGNSGLAAIHGIPNVQQSIDFLTPQQLSRFIRTIVVRNIPIILSSSGFLLCVPPSPPGHFARIAELISCSSIPEPCPAGTYKETNGPFPCIVCPAGFKTDAIDSEKNGVISCVRCDDDVFCPPGSIGNVNLSDYPSISQAYPYPITPTSSTFDDIIFTNAFQFDTSSIRCLRLSPIFWTLIILGIISVILVVVSFLQWVPKAHGCYQNFKRILRHTDIIGDGELWIGGLASFAILILIIFSFWFGLQFLRQYPIESSSDSKFACDRSLRNAKFSSSLQLLSLLKSKEEKLIFEMLDDQNWTLTLDFIQTAFRCDQMKVQGDIESQPIDILIDDCFLRPDNVTITTIITLPSHAIDLYVNFTGGSYVGAVRICLNGPFEGSQGNLTVVQEIEFCQLLSTNDQTMSQTTSITADLTKVINRTETLSSSEDPRYSGIWIPTITVKTFTDRVVYNQKGAYQRYLSAKQIFWLHLAETPFFVKNHQEPIALLGEIIFNNILFSTTVIELFGLAFLFLKLGFSSIFKRILSKFDLRRTPPQKERMRF